MRERLLTILVAGGLIAAAGCGSPRAMRYYTLEAPTTAMHSGEPAYPITLLVGRISSPHILRDDRIAYGTTSVERGLYFDYRWTEPPSEMLQTMILQQLRGSGKYKTVQRITSSSRGDYILRGHMSSLTEMDLPTGIVGRFAIQMELYQQKSGSVVWTQSYYHDEPVANKKVNDVVEALQRNVQNGLNELATGLEQYFASQAGK